MSDFGELTVNNNNTEVSGERVITKESIKQPVRAKNAKILEYLKRAEKMYLVNETENDLEGMTKGVIVWRCMYKQYAMFGLNSEQIFTIHEDEAGHDFWGCLCRSTTTYCFYDENLSEVFSLEHYFNPYGSQSCTVYDSCKNVIGTVKHTYDSMRYIYWIYDAEDKKIFKLSGPSYYNCINTDEFQILEIREVEAKIKVGKKSKARKSKQANGKVEVLTEIGKYTRNWDGLSKEYYQAYKTCSVTFLPELDLTKKIILTAVTVYLDYIYFRYEHAVAKAWRQDLVKEPEDDNTTGKEETQVTSDNEKPKTSKAP